MSCICVLRSLIATTPTAAQQQQLQLLQGSVRQRCVLAEHELYLRVA
jgi:hypothetical protein